MMWEVRIGRSPDRYQIRPEEEIDAEIASAAR